MEEIDNHIKILLIICLSLFTLGCQKAELSEEEKNAYIQKGDQIVQTAFVTLSTELVQQIEQKGTVGAIQYCNLNALNLTDSVGHAFQATLKRTSLQLRNEKNKPSELEEKLLDDYQNKFATGETLNTRITKFQDQVLYTKPIMVNQLCLKCHGVKDQQVDTDTWSALQKNYPHDQATGYQEGDLRGMWSITFSLKD